MTLSLTNVSTQNTQIYQVATSNPTTSYTAIQASHVSTGTTNNALVINPSGGNVGIGTTAPTAKLHIPTVDSTSISTSVLAFGNTGGGYGIYANSIGIAARGNTLDWYSYDYTAGAPATRSVLTMRPEGTVGIGTTAPGTTLDVLGSFRVRGAPNASTYSQSLTVTTYNGGGPYSSYTSIQAAHEGSAANDLSLNRGGGNILMGGTVLISPLTTNGTVITINSIGQLSVSSDRRIKENIVYQSDTQQGLASVLNLKPATYTMIGSSGSYLGFIAQDVEQEIPLAVDGKKYEWQWETTEDGKPKFDANGDIVYKLDADGNRIVRPRGVSDRAIIATQTLAIQELSKKLDATQQQLAAKSASLDALIAWAQTQGYVAPA